jgi:dolichol-phosphate mannosyltransferase
MFDSRRIRNLPDYPWFKLRMNRLANLFIRIMFGFKLNDTTNAFKAYRTSVINGCRPILSPDHRAR